MREEFNKPPRQRHIPQNKLRVVLSDEDRQTLHEVIDDPANKVQRWRANVLLALDESQSSATSPPTYEEIAQFYEISVMSVYRTAKRFIEHGLLAALHAAVTGGKLFTPSEEAELRRLVEYYDQHHIPWSARGLASELGRDSKTIGRALDRLSIERKTNSPPEP